jgi:hypothetical protein
LTERSTGIALALAALVALAAAGAWYEGRIALREARTQLVAEDLQQMAALLQEDQALMQELRSEAITQNGSSVLGSYIAEIRRDGLSKHADMKQRLDQLAENNTGIVTLIRVYSPHARTPAFRVESDKFRNYASAWRDRWNSVMELFMAGGNYATSEVPFPNGFPAAVRVEIAADR